MSEKVGGIINEFVLPGFLEAMNDIGRYGFQKYADQSFQSKALNGDITRSMERTQSESIRDHAVAHFQMHINGVLHDHFGTRKHQLAAVAFNAMMEYYFAGLEEESTHEQ